MATATAEVKIGGMSCGHCVAAVEKALDGLAGIAGRRVRVGAAEVEFDPARVTLAEIRAAITAAGYEAA